MNIDVSPVVRIREPGLGSEWLGRERYVVRGGAVIAVPLLAGDELEIIDPEGLQQAHVFAFNSASEAVTGALGVTPTRMVPTIAAMLDSSSPGAIKIRNRLESFSIDLPLLKRRNSCKGIPRRIRR